MQKPARPSLLWYYYLFKFIAKERLQKNDLDPRKIHTHLVTMLSTGILMWGYAFLAWHTISTPIPGVIGFICSAVHFISPLFFRITHNTFLVSNILIGAGLIHQASFSYFSGGIMSFCVKWFAILPLLAGITSGLKGALTWFFITILVSSGFLYLYLIDYPLSFMISPEGYLIGTSMIQFGFIFLTTVIIMVFVALRENTEKVLNRQSQKIDDLFRVLFHDLANPLGRLGIGLSIAKRGSGDTQTNRGITIATEASQSMLEITQNVRKMYAVSKGKADLNVMPVSLNECVQYVQNIMSNELTQKDVHITFDHESHYGINLMVEPVSFKNQVLGNIISNAIKFSHPGGFITLSAKAVNDETFAVEIKDTGVGMPEHILNTLFDMNTKTSRPGTIGESGTGFGLHIMRSFVEMYGGKVEVASQESKGTTFRLLLKGHRK